MYRPNAGNPPRKNHLVQSVFFILLVTAAGYIMLQSPFFEIKTISVSGNRQLSKVEISKLSGINTGSNIFKVNLTKSEERLKLVPLIKTIEMKRSLPDKINISVIERTSVALLPVQNGFIKVDSDGVYLQRGQVASALPIITGIDMKLNGPGQKVESEKLPEALQVLEQLPQALIMKLSEINVNEAGQIIIYTLDGVQGRMGLSEEMEYKGNVFMEVLNNLKQPGNLIQYIDLSNPRVPVVKYIKHQQEGQQ